MAKSDSDSDSVSRTKKTVDLAFSTALQKLKVNPEKFSKKKTGFPQIVEIMDLEQDGQPEVFVNFIWCPDVEGSDVGVSLLLDWQNNQWVSLLHGYYKWLEMTDFAMEEIGEGFITALWPLDTDGDGIADVIISEVPGPSITVDYYLYQIKKGQIKKILYLGYTTWG